MFTGLVRDLEKMNNAEIIKNYKALLEEYEDLEQQYDDLDDCYSELENKYAELENKYAALANGIDYDLNENMILDVCKFKHELERQNLMSNSLEYFLEIYMKFDNN